jgi:hypothetical protein
MKQSSGGTPLDLLLDLSIVNCSNIFNGTMLWLQPRSNNERLELRNSLSDEGDYSQF